MYATNFDLQPLSPVSDNETWMKYLADEVDTGYQNSFTTQGADYNDVFTNYASMSSPEEPLSYKINLNSVNDKLNALDDFSDNSSGSSPIFQQPTSDSSSSYSFASNKSAKNSKRRASRKKLTESQKAAHNVIEKKYRININTKIERLQKLIPSITTEEAGFKTSNRVNSSNDMTVKKLNKSLILDKALEYIEFLQGNQLKIMTENSELKSQLNASNIGYI